MERFDVAGWEMEKFHQEHPESEGWRVHRIEPNIRAIFTPNLPAFLRAKLPAGSFEENIYTDVGFTYRGGTRTRLTELPRKRKGRGLSEDEWFGDERFVWNGVPIHYRRIPLPPEGMAGARPALTLIATKDWAALENLWTAGFKFVKMRRKVAQRIVRVINGRDFPRPKAHWEDVILPPEQKRQIRESVEAFLVAKPKYKELGLPYRRGFLFSGPPGNGKTLAAKVIAAQYKVSMVTLLIKSDIEERTIDAAFSAAAQYPPCLLLLEDLDKIVNCTRVSLSYLLNMLDGLTHQEGVIIIATTNEPQRLDPALLHRPSRFDRVWDFKLPAFEERLALLRLKGGKYFSETALESAAKASSGFSMAYVQEAVVSALMAAVHGKKEVTDADLENSVRQLRGQIKESSNGCKPIGSVQSIGFGKNGD